MTIKLLHPHPRMPLSAFDTPDVRTIAFNSLIFLALGSLGYFNLGFGDLNKATGKIDDLAVTDNQDRKKVLATVAATLLEFTRQFPDAAVYATGSTPARTRLYQIGITARFANKKIKPP
jgi:uncharacterized protein DUF6934